MNRRGFLKAIGIATAGLYLRIAPSLAVDLRDGPIASLSEINEFFAARAALFQAEILRRVAISNPFFDLLK